jgi:Zn-dependent protease with chaperone function
MVAVSMAYSFGEKIFVILVDEGLVRYNTNFSELSYEIRSETGIALALVDARNNLEQSFLRLLIPIALALIVILVAYILYRNHPSRIRLKKNLQIVYPEQKPSLVMNIQDLSKSAGISPPPSIEIEVGSCTTDGQAFGFQNRYSLRIGSYLDRLLCKRPLEFRAVILHELAHIANKDIGRTYFAQSIWSVVIPIYLIGNIIMVTVGTIRHIQKFLLDGNWGDWFTGHLPNNYLLCIQMIIIVLIASAIFNSLLRVREVYADVRAALWGAEEELKSIFSKSKANESYGFWRGLFSLHPNSKERLSSMANPIELFNLKIDLPIYAGIFLAIMMNSLVTFGLELFVQIEGWFTIDSLLVNQQTLFMTNFFEKYLKLVTVTVGLRLGMVISLLLGLSILLMGAYFLSGTVGVQVQRDTISKMLSAARKKWWYYGLLLPAFLVAVSLQIGFFLAPDGVIFASILSYFHHPFNFLRILRDLGLMTIWISATTGLIWLWLVYIRFFSKRLLGLHAGLTSPEASRRWLTFSSSILLWILFLPAIVGQWQIGNIMWDSTTAFSPSLLLNTVEYGLLLYLVFFGVTLFAVQIYKWNKNSICPTCGQVTHQSFAVGRNCETCGNDLALWLYVQET